MNLEPILGFMLEIKSITIYLDRHTVSAMCFNMGIYLKKLSKYKVELENKFCTFSKKKEANIDFFLHTIKKLTIKNYFSMLLECVWIALGLSMFFF